jgi:hypothetical protein
VSILIAGSDLTQNEKQNFIVKCRSKIDQIESFVITSGLDQESVNKIDKNIRLLSITLARIENCIY